MPRDDEAPDDASDENTVPALPDMSGRLRSLSESDIDNGVDFSATEDE